MQHSSVAPVNIEGGIYVSGERDDDNHRYILGRAEEGCPSIARPWAVPLADFIIDEFLALCCLYSHEFRDHGNIDSVLSPLGSEQDIDHARQQLSQRHAPPVLLAVGFPSRLASKVSKRLITGTLHRVIFEAPSLSQLRALFVRHVKTQCQGIGKVDVVSSQDSGQVEIHMVPHVLLQIYMKNYMPDNHLRIGAKRRKKILADLLSDTYFDTMTDKSGRKGCGSKHKPNETINQRQHMIVIVPDTITNEGVKENTFYFTEPLNVHQILGFVNALPPPPAALGRATPIRSELSWVLANMANIKSGSCVLDPFAGTGSLLRPCHHLGAIHTLALDIKVSVFQRDDDGDETVDRVCANARYLPFRYQKGGLFDAIICDPPYGLRKHRMKSEHLTDNPVEDSKSMQIAVASAMDPIIAFAASSSGLSVGGRLVFLFPTFHFSNSVKGSDQVCPLFSDYRDTVKEVIPKHSELQLVSICTQRFKGMSRHVVVLEKLGVEKCGTE